MYGPGVGSEDDPHVVALHVPLLVVVVLDGHHHGPILVVRGDEVLVIVADEVGSIAAGRVVDFELGFDLSLSNKHTRVVYCILTVGKR